ncbi:matrixin family metalloprotease [Synechocystis sp. FACHB-383]|uniref:matrixin family metalloprotease n=1 Tax=Synechocystis sp. FACHB-383 TaxID=2692864 RepID=UPI0016891A45|nr:matrixin family metalloprotease [Synechocystis sp. FACHB-383]MBD2652710.1 matrixin family metalloprotease [Synechocystis sp. FACHB-383]
MKERIKPWARFLALLLLTLLLVNLPAIASNGDKPTLPALQVHPLPPELVDLGISLENRSFSGDDGSDYFAQVQSSPLGHLVWSRFPVTVAVDYPPALTPGSAAQKRYYTWQQAIKTAIADWQSVFPLTMVENTAGADIVILYREPPLARTVDPETGLVSFGRARTAQASYEFYWTDTSPPQLRHRMAIAIKPGLAPLSLQGTARHELGHALGIWGHSDREEDALYPAQTANVPAISPRDLRTLYRIYQQPTRLGWPAPVTH